VFRAGGLFETIANGTSGVAGKGFIGTMCTAHSAHFVVVSIFTL